jgi:hypothetical protein
MAKPKRKAKVENALLQAVKFVSFAAAKTESETDTHCLIENYSVVMNNNVIAIGHSIEEDFSACPQVQSLILALQRCGEQYAITLHPESLSVRSQDFSAFVPCCPSARLLQAIPDTQICPVSDELTKALGFCLPVVSDKADYLLNAVIQIREGSAIAYSGGVLIEAFHGQDLPYMIINKTVVAAMVKCGLQLTGFGYSGETATFWFGEKAWIKTKLFNPEDCKFPDIRTLMNTEVDLVNIPEGFFEAVKNVAPFSADKRVYIEGNKVGSHQRDNEGSRTENIKGYSFKPRKYDIAALKLVEKFAKRMDECAHNTATFFYGDKIRAAVAHSIVHRCTNPDCKGECDICTPF